MSIFSDAFTVGSDTELHAYNPFYTAIAYASSTTATVRSAQGNIFPVAESLDCYYRCAPTGFPSGDQNVSADIVAVDSGGSGSCYLFARVSDATSAAKMYALEVNQQGSAVRLLYIDSDTFTQLLSSTTVAPTGTHNYKLEITGAGATVTIKWYLDGVLQDTVTDSSATRLTSGAQGVGFWVGNGNLNTYSIDNFVIDAPAGGTTQNFSGSGSSTATGALHQKAQHKVAGSITPAGTFSGTVVPGTQFATLSGSITPAGAITVAAGIDSVVGSVAPSGSVTFAIIGGVVQDNFAGSVTPQGIVHLQAKHTVAGSITGTGALAMHSPTILTSTMVGSCTPSGAIRNVQLPPARGEGHGWIHHRWHRR